MNDLSRGLVREQRPGKTRRRGAMGRRGGGLGWTWRDTTSSVRGTVRADPRRSNRPNVQRLGSVPCARKRPRSGSALMSPRAIAGASNDSTRGHALGERRPRLLRPFGVLSLHRSTVTHAGAERRTRATNAHRIATRGAPRPHTASIRHIRVPLRGGTGRRPDRGGRVWRAGRPALVVEVDVVDAGREGARLPLVGEGREER